MRKFLIGCCVFGGVLLLAVFLAVLAVRSWIGKNFPDSDQIETRHAELEKRFGAPDAFVPPLDGVPSAERVAQFVALREALVTPRRTAADRLRVFFERVHEGRSSERPWITKAIEVVGNVRGGGEMAVAMASYFGGRDRMLLENDMGEGEYRYLYGLTYFCWMGWEPLADSTAIAEIRKVDADLVDDIMDARGRTGRLLRTQFENQERALVAQSVRTPAQEAALVALRAELPLSQRTESFPFVGRVPPAWSAPLVPYRDRLQATLPSGALEVGLDVMRFQPRGNRGISIESN
jgi:hypothetical protein